MSKDSFVFAKEIVEEDFFMWSLMLILFLLTSHLNRLSAASRRLIGIPFSWS